MKNARFVPKWQPDENITAVEMISKICSCSTTCKNGSKKDVKCLIFVNVKEYTIIMTT